MASETINIALDGDVILVIGGVQDGEEEPSRIKLRVHSVILSSASKTFMAMFGPHFSEGQDLSSTSPKEVELPDDDPTSMLHLCNTLHHKANFEGPQDVDGLLALAIHCDKYDCLHAMKFASAIWLDRMVSTCDKFAAELEKISATVEARSGNSAKVVKLLAAAYLFESPLAFGRISALPLLRFEGPFSEAQCGSIIPWRAFMLLEDSRYRIRSKLLEGLQGIAAASAKKLHGKVP